MNDPVHGPSVEPSAAGAGTAGPAPATVVAGLVLSVLLGAVTAALGAALPVLRSAYGTGDAAGTEVVVAYNLGALLALLGSGPLERRLPGRSVVSWLLAAFAAGCAGMAVAPAWWALTGCALLTGLGFGGLVLYANTAFGRPGGARGVRLLNWLHAAFGAGATTGPLLVGEWGAVRELLWAVAALTLCCVPFRSAADGSPTGPGPRRPVRAGRPPSAALVACAAVALLYAGVEAGIGALEATHLAATGHTPQDAARLSALFWAGLTVGRLLLPLAARRVPHPLLVLGSLLAGAGALTAATDPGLAPAAYGLAGICLAGAFPTLLAWTVTVLPGPRRVSGVLLTANLAGSAALPFLLGHVTDPAAPASVPLALAALTLVAGAALLTAVRAARPTSQHALPPAHPPTAHLPTALAAAHPPTARPPGADPTPARPLRASDEKEPSA
ncbi:MFS transporter [Streptomyces coeruleoprunus]